MSTSHSSSVAKSAPAHRRPSSIRQGPPLSRSSGGRAASGGRDVTPTSPSNSAASLVSIRPLPPHSTLYQPPPSPRPSFSTSVAAAPSPTPSDQSSSTSSSKTPAKKMKENTGRWLTEEHAVFLKGLNEHGKQWKKIAIMIQTRSVVQVRTHAQKYFQKLLKNGDKTDGGDIAHLGKERSASILSTASSTSTSVPNGTASMNGSIKRKSSKGNKTTAKKRRVSLEPKVKKHHYPAAEATVHFHHHSFMGSAPQMPEPTVAMDPNVIDPSFMNALNMAEGELDDSLLDLLDDSSVEAVEHVIGSSPDTVEMDLEPNVVEPNPVSPSVSSMSLVDSHPGMTATVSRHDMVTSPQPEDFSIHHTIGTGQAGSGVVQLEHSPTSVACVMGVEDFEQKTAASGNYVDALDWLMDVGVHQLPATDGETEEQEHWGHMNATTKLALAPQVHSTGDVF